MQGPYEAKLNKEIHYVGNKIFDPLENVTAYIWPERDLRKRVDSIHDDRKWYHLHNIDAGIFAATIEFFKGIGADWVNLPLTTMMISSPGEVYAGQQLDYTTDTLPIEIPNWFQTGKRAFLTESSQFYLELRDCWVLDILNT